MSTSRVPVRPKSRRRRKSAQPVSYRLLLFGAFALIVVSLVAVRGAIQGTAGFFYATMVIAIVKPVLRVRGSQGGKSALTGLLPRWLGEVFRRKSKAPARQPDIGGSTPSDEDSRPRPLTTSTHSKKRVRTAVNRSHP
jgi:hypothetical protein